MPHRSTSFPVPIVHLRPPYRVGESAAHRVPDPAAFGPGSILLADVRTGGAEAGRVGDWVPRLRVLARGAPLVIQATGWSGRELARVAEQAARLRVRAVLTEEGPLLETLRPLMTTPADLAGDVVEWLALRGVGLPPVLAHLVSSMFSLVATHDHLSELLAAIGESETGTRARLRRRGLPAPGRWFHAARALNVALRLQAAQGVPLHAMALEMGYADHSALCQLLRRVFDVRPGDVRGTLGWEWLMERWLVRGWTSPRLPGERM